MSIVSRQKKKDARIGKTNPDQYFTNQLISLKPSLPFTDGMANKAKVTHVLWMDCTWCSEVRRTVWTQVAVWTIYNRHRWKKLKLILNSLRFILQPFDIFTPFQAPSFFLLPSYGSTSGCFPSITWSSLDLFMSRRNASQLTISLSSCEWKLLFRETFMTPFKGWRLKHRKEGT